MLASVYASIIVLISVVIIIIHCWANCCCTRWQKWSHTDSALPCLKVLSIQQCLQKKKCNPLITEYFWRFGCFIQVLKQEKSSKKSNYIFLFACTVSYKLAVQPSLICRCIMVTHVSCCVYTHIPPGYSCINIWCMYILLFHSESNIHGGRAREILFIGEIFVVKREINSKKLIWLLPNILVQIIAILLYRGCLKEGGPFAMLQTVL